jgi:hypothetical protein
MQFTFFYFVYIRLQFFYYYSRDSRCLSWLFLKYLQFLQRFLKFRLTAAPPERKKTETHTVALKKIMWPRIVLDYLSNKSVQVLLEPIK